MFMAASSNPARASRIAPARLKGRMPWKSASLFTFIHVYCSSPPCPPLPPLQPRLGKRGNAEMGKREMGKRENGFQLRVSIFQFPISSFRSPVYTPSFDDSMSRFPPFSSFFPLLHSIKDWLEPGWVNGERGKWFCDPSRMRFRNWKLEIRKSKLKSKFEVGNHFSLLPISPPHSPEHSMTQ